MQNVPQNELRELKKLKDKYLVEIASLYINNTQENEPLSAIIKKVAGLKEIERRIAALQNEVEVKKTA